MRQAASLAGPRRGTLARGRGSSVAPLTPLSGTKTLTMGLMFLASFWVPLSPLVLVPRHHSRRDTSHHYLRTGRGGAGPLFQDSVIPVFHILSILCLVDRIALVLKQNGQVLYECISASSRGSISLCIQSLEVPAIKRKLSCTKLRVNAPHTTYILTGRLARPDSPSRRPWAAGCLGTKTTPPKEPHSGLASSPLCRHKGREAARRPTSRRHLAPRQHRWNMYYSGAQPGNKGQNLLQLRSDIRKDK